MDDLALHKRRVAATGDFWSEVARQMKPPSMALRSAEPEQLDRCDFVGSELSRALLDLERFNRWLGGNCSLLRAVKRALPLFPKRPLTVVDVGCGSGDGLRMLARWGASNGTVFRLHGLDANAAVIDLAKQRSHGLPISYIVGDAFGDAIHALEPDIVITNQFLHHFALSELELRLPKLLRSTRVLVISDLRRSVLAHVGFGLLSRLLRASPIAIHDGLVSIRRGFTRSELIGLVQLLHVRRAEIRCSDPFRYELLLVP